MGSMQSFCAREPFDAAEFAMKAQLQDATSSPGDDLQKLSSLEGHDPACVSDTQKSHVHEEKLSPSSQISGDGVHPPPPTEPHFDGVPLDKYNGLLEREKHFRQSFYGERERNLEYTRHIEAQNRFLHSNGVENVESLFSFTLYIKEQYDHRNKDVIEYQKICKDLSSKIEQLEHLHSQKAMADSGSYQDSTATPPLLQTAADGVNDAIAVCASELFSTFKKNANIVSNFAAQFDLPIEHRSPSIVKVTLQALLCRILFTGFGDPYYSLGGSHIPPFEVPSEQKSQLFQVFRKCRDRDARQVLEADSNFKDFAHVKARDICEAMKAGLPSADDDTEMQSGGFSGLDLLNVNDRNLNRSFMRLAKAVWVLHKLGLAFEPSAEIFHVGSGSVFNEMFMEDIAHDEDTEEFEGMTNMKPHKQVKFMCVPAFTVRHTIIKARVFCFPDMQPQAHSNTKNDPNFMMVDDEVC